MRTHHIHVYFQGAPEWDRYLTFRDRLRASTVLREEYGALKRKLAEKNEDDRFAYTAGKAEVTTATHLWCHWRSIYVKDPEGNIVELVCYDETVR